MKITKLNPKPKRKANRRFAAARGSAPVCKCGKPCQLYGGVGGYSTKCQKCNADNAARQRVDRAIKKACEEARRRVSGMTRPQRDKLYKLGMSIINKAQNGKVQR